MLLDVSCECSRTEAFWKEVIMALNINDETVEWLCVGSGKKKKRYIRKTLKKQKLQENMRSWANCRHLENGKTFLSFFFFFFK